MECTEFERDPVLMDFLCDYLDQVMGRGERASFENYLALNNAEAEFADKAARGKNAMDHLRRKMNVSPESETAGIGH